MSIATLYRALSQSALVLLRPGPAHWPQADQEASMNIAVTPENINSRALFAGKVVLVTGSTSGIGLGIARAMAAAGADIVLNGFGKPEEVADVQQSLASDFQVRVSYSSADMSKPQAIREM